MIIRSKGRLESMELSVNGTKVLDLKLNPSDKNSNQQDLTSLSMQGESLDNNQMNSRSGRIVSEVRRGGGKKLFV